eukprot:g14710.t1
MQSAKDILSNLQKFNATASRTSTSSDTKADDDDAPRTPQKNRFLSPEYQTSAAARSARSPSTQKEVDRFSKEAAAFVLKMVKNALPGTNWDELPLPPNRMVVANVGLEYPPTFPPGGTDSAAADPSTKKTVRAKIHMRIQRPKLGVSPAKQFDVCGEVTMKIARIEYEFEYVFANVMQEIADAGFLTVRKRNSKELIRGGNLKIRTECSFAECEIFASTTGGSN